MPLGKNYSGGQRDLALHATNPDFIPDTIYGSPKSTNGHTWAQNLESPLSTAGCSPKEKKKEVKI